MPEQNTGALSNYMHLTDDAGFVETRKRKKKKSQLQKYASLSLPLC